MLRFAFFCKSATQPLFHGNGSDCTVTSLVSLTYCCSSSTPRNRFIVRAIIMSHDSSDIKYGTEEEKPSSATMRSSEGKQGLSAAEAGAVDREPALPQRDGNPIAPDCPSSPPSHSTDAPANTHSTFQEPARNYEDEEGKWQRLSHRSPLQAATRSSSIQRSSTRV